MPRWIGPATAILGLTALAAAAVVVWAPVVAAVYLAWTLTVVFAGGAA